MNVVYLYFVNKLFLVGRYWDFKTMTFVLEKVKNIVEKGDNVGYHHFLHFKNRVTEGC